MNLSRKRRKELKRLRAEAEQLLLEQREVMGRAGVVLAEASRQARKLSNEQLAPRVRDAVDTARPMIDRGFFAARTAFGNLRRAAAPAVSSALVSTVRALDAIDDPRAKQASSALLSYGRKTGLAPKPKSRAGLVVGAVLATLAAVGVGYSLYQTYRSDDELWISGDEDPNLPS